MGGRPKTRAGCPKTRRGQVIRAMRVQRARVLVVLAAAALAAAACGDGPSAPARTLARLELATDSTALWGYPGSATVERLVVRAVDRTDNPVPGVLVSFQATEGGSAEPSQATSGADGLAATTWVLGPALGAHHMTVRADGAGPLVVAAAARQLVELDGDTLFVALADTVRVLRVNTPPGRSWTARVVEESRWLDDVEVVNVRRLQNPPRLELQARSPGTARVEVEAGDAAQSLWFVVAPVEGEGPVVLDIRQPDWPADPTVVLRGYNLDQVPFPAVLVDGEPATLAYQDSAEILVRPAPMGRGACSGPAAATGVLSVLGATVVAEPVVMRASGPLISLALGEAERLDSNDTCLRLLLSPGARIAVAGVDRSFVDRARNRAEAVTYGGHPMYTIFMADSTPGVRFSASVRRESSSRDTVRHWPSDVVPYRPSASLAAANVYVNTEPYVPGDEFEWSTNNGRYGTYQVMALYPPNVVLAVFKEDLPELWSDARKAAMDSLFMELGSDDVQGMYKNVFGPTPPATSPATGQMLVMFHDGVDGEGTGVNNPYGPDNRYSTIHFRRVHFQDDNGWYRNLVSHEFAHAWHFRNIEGFSAVWSIEGIANLFAEEFLRISAGLSLDANHDYDQRIRNWSLRLPASGSFAAGYRESHPFLRHLVARLVLTHGQSYESAVRRVVRGAALGWYGRHFVRWGSDEAVRGPGLVDQMQEVVPGWDPVEARLDWMLSFALDDRAPFQEYGIAFARDAWRHFGPVQDIRLGSGHEAFATAVRAGNLYYLLSGGTESATVRLRIASGEPTMAWKVVRFR